MDYCTPLTILMKLYLIIFFAICSLRAHAQADTTLYGYVDSVTFRPAEIPPIFPGGPSVWKNYLNNRLIYPASERKKKIRGTVVVEFTVARSGETSDFKIVHSVDSTLDAEALKFLKDAHLFLPAIHEGQQVAYRMRQAIEFK